MSNCGDPLAECQAQLRQCESDAEEFCQQIHALEKRAQKAEAEWYHTDDHLIAARQKIEELEGKLRSVRAHCCSDGWHVCEECGGCTIATICQLVSKE
jgi:chromosome segregation ATPase